MTRERLSDHNVVGILSGMDAAREAIVALGRAGVESDKVSLLGRLAEEAAAAPDTREGPVALSEAPYRRLEERGHLR